MRPGPCSRAQCYFESKLDATVAGLLLTSVDFDSEGFASEDFDSDLELESDDVESELFESAFESLAFESPLLDSGFFGTTPPLP